MRHLSAAAIMVALAACSSPPPPVTPPSPLDPIVSSLPAELVPDTNETKLKTQSRALWFHDHTKGQRVVLSGTMEELEPHPDGSVDLTLNGGNAHWFGRDLPLTFVATFTRENADALMSITKGKSVTVDAAMETIMIFPTDNRTGVILTDARLSKL